MIIIQVGFLNGYNESQKVNAFINGEKVTWIKDFDGQYNGHFSTDMASRQRRIWFLARCECNPGDIIKMESSVFIKSQGFDEERSRIAEFMVDENAEPFDYEIRRVGDSHFPLISGKVVMVQSVSKIQERRNIAESLIMESKE